MYIEDGTRDSYQLAFGDIDNDGSKTIDLSELLDAYGIPSGLDLLVSVH